MQASLFGQGEPRSDERFAGLVHHELSGAAWVDYVPNWLSGHDVLFHRLAAEAAWLAHRRNMYDRIVDVPRLTAALPSGTASANLLMRISRRLSARYHLEFESISLAFYRNGQDSVAPHGDKMGPLVDNTIVATVSVGAPRRFLLRPVEGTGGLDLALGAGDLFVMGGACQRTWRHAVPKVGHADPRISIMFRPRVPDVARSRGVVFESKRRLIA